MNLQALELVVRLFLTDATGQKVELPKEGAKSAPETYLTNRDSLGTLIDTFNVALGGEEIDAFHIDRSVVTIRDSLAHGRLLPDKPTPLVMLHKFGKPEGNAVPIERAELLTDNWLAETVQLIHNQVVRVVACGQARKQKTFAEIEVPT